MTLKRYVIALLVLLVASATGASPTIEHVGFVAPDIIELVVRAGRVNVGAQVPYAEENGDVVKGSGHRTYLWRHGRKIGVIVGNAPRMLRPFDTFEADPLDAGRLAQPATYRIGSPDDERYQRPEHPGSVFRKSRPIGIARVDDWRFQAPVEHHFFLRVPHALRADARYTISLAGAPIPDRTFSYQPVNVRSEAVHVSHLGFHPDDPAKVAFLSCWMGDGGGLDYSDGLRFHIVVAGSGAVVHSGTVRLTKPATAKDEDAYERNFNLTNVYEMDFSALKKPGTYRVVVDGVGCSYPFRIDNGLWSEAFVTAARGSFHQRSGVALGPPHTCFRRPRSFHPDDGVKVYASTTRLMDTRNGLSRSDPDNFRNLVAGKTDQLVADAWGGYMDAGDWDRRIQHLIASVYLLDLAERFGGFFRTLSLNIPESGNDLPDVVDEALFNLDCYRRMQTPEGGIRGGIESAEHPNLGETSWQESLTVMAYAPGSWSSFTYAAVAAKAACTLKSLGADELADVYARSAVRAMNWAESDYAQRDRRGRSYQAGGVEIERMDHDHRVNDARNHAAAELFRLTGEDRWHRVFVETTKLNQPGVQLYVWRSHEQREAAWAYLNTPHTGADQRLRQYCRQATLREADDRLRTQSRTAFRWSKNDWAPPTATLSVSDVVSVVRAHLLTGQQKYLEAVVLACQMGLGANPLNLCYTTGLGHRWPGNPLHLDSRHTGQQPPEGLTVFGPVDPTGNDAFIKTVIRPFCFPSPEQWPIVEAYWDVFWYPMMCEFTIHHPMSYNAYTWGYLAAVADR